MLGKTAILELGAAGLIAVVAVAMVAQALAQRDLARHIQLVVAGEDKGRESQSVRSILLNVLRLLGSYVQHLSVFSAKDIEELERTARAAGLSPDAAVPAVIGGKMVLMLACPVVAYLVTRNLTWPWPIVWTCAGVGFGIFGPNLAISFVRRKRTKALRLGLGDALDLLVVCAEAGLGLESAIDRVATEMKLSSPEVAVEFSTLGQDLRLSADRGSALLRMGERTGLDSFQRLTMTLAQTLRYGTPLGQALRVLAVEMRNDRMLCLEEKAARLPTLMMLPLAGFILPCLFIVVAGPAALRLMSIIQ